MNTVTVAEVLQNLDFTIPDLEGLNALLKEFDPGARQLVVKELHEITRDDCLIIARNSETRQIVGMATLITYRRPTGLIGRVEDVIVTEGMRRRGVGRQIMTLLVRVAQEKGCLKLNLTTRPSREAARILYRSIGFKEKDTGTFQLVL